MTVEERVSKNDIESLGIVARLRDDGKMKVDVMVKLVGERHAYQTTYKTSRELLDASKDLLGQMFQEMEKHLREVLRGEKELNAVV